MADREYGGLELVNLAGETESEEEIIFSSPGRGSARRLLRTAPPKLEDVLSNGTSRGKATLKKELNIFNGVTMIVGSIIGSGIFISPKIVLCHSGSFGVSMITWLVGAFITLAGALCYVELGLLIRSSGGDYSFLLEAYSFNRKTKIGTAFGSCVAFLYVWGTSFIVRPGSFAILALTCSHYLSQPFFIGCVAPDRVVKLLALCVILAASLLNAYSVKLTGLVIAVVTTLKLFAVAFIAILGIGIIVSKQSFPEDVFHPRDGFKLTASDLALAFTAFSGPTMDGTLYSMLLKKQRMYRKRQTVTHTHARRTLPRSLFIGIPIVAVCYLFVNVAYFGVLSYDQILTGEAVALTFGDVALGKVGLVVIPLMVALSTSGAAVSSVYSGSRVLFVASRDGMLPGVFAGLHAKFNTPTAAIIFQAVGGSLMVLIGNISDLLNGLSAAVYLFYTLIFISLIIMRFTRTREPRPFKAWFIIPVTVFVILTCLFLTFLPIQQKPIPSLLAFGVILTGLPVYLLLVMETPWLLRPTLLDLISGKVTKFTNALLNAQ